MLMCCMHTWVPGVETICYVHGCCSARVDEAKRGHAAELSRLGEEHRAAVSKVEAGRTALRDQLLVWARPGGIMRSRGPAPSGLDFF
jgi:hypothetical protein